MTFHPEYDLRTLHPASYNPRQIHDDAFAQLRESIRTLGLIKPIIATLSGTLIAGHQRTKAMLAEGITHCPAFILGDVTIQDEIRFNQLHNAADLEISETLLSIPSQNTFGYVTISPDKITGSLSSQGAAKRAEILRLLTKHGEWGSIIATQNGKILISALYINACKVLGIPCKAYIVPNEQESLIIGFFSQQYGVFSYEHLQRTTWGQTLAQKKRLRNSETDNKGGHSRTYECLVFPRITKSMRILDFGAGQMDYVKKLKNLGYDIHGLEFYHRSGGLLNVSLGHKMIDEVCTHLCKYGMYDMVICDSVLNSVDSLVAEHSVLCCLSALTRYDGYIIFSGRSRDDVEYSEYKTSKYLRHTRNVCFIDQDGFSAIYDQGVWRYQKFHTSDEVHAIIKKYYGFSYKIYDLISKNKIYEVKKNFKATSWGVCAKKTFELSLEQREEAFRFEFDLPLPSGKRYGRSNDIIAAYGEALKHEKEVRPK